MPKTKAKAEFGDFQTPAPLAEAVCRVVGARAGGIRSVLEPTCGQGAFLAAALGVFEEAQVIRGYDLNEQHLADAALQLEPLAGSARVTLQQADFFRTDWAAVLERLPPPVLVVGNPPWVTNADLGVLGSANLPVKSNLHGLKGLDALTGKSNFDISEWMVLRLLGGLEGVGGTLAMLVKTGVARKVLKRLWSSSYPVRDAALLSIDAKGHFGAAVDACLLTLSTGQGAKEPRCEVYSSLTAGAPDRVLGFDGTRLLADAEAFGRRQHLLAGARAGWRSGVKHDCARVFELRRTGRRLENGFGERVTLEEELVFPLLKSSHVAHGRLDSQRYVLLPQRAMGEDTSGLRARAPRAWAYLQAHGERLDARKSSIYRNKPRFSIFGIGDYSFSPWKIAISGLYKRFRFTVVGPREGKPVMLDDTVYFLACDSEGQARQLAALLNGEVAADFFAAFLFRDAKRPVTARLLNRLDLQKLATE